MQELLEQLDSFDPSVRRSALSQLQAMAVAPAAERDWHNMHLHTFFSFNGDGHSPVRLAWDAKQQGLYSIAICDFDVLAGLDELLHAGDVLELRTAVGFEGRTFFAEYATQDINSPGEPGVFYFMGMGFAAEPARDTCPGQGFAEILAKSHERNRALISRVNSQLGNMTVDYDADVLPLTPKGNATERHIVRAYHEKALCEFRGCTDTAAAFWASCLELDLTDTCRTILDTNAFMDVLRSKLMKRGGLGYVQPTRETFPALDDVIRIVLDCDAIPMSTWLDGTSDGESDPAAQLECLMAKGVAAVNIIPDRNWNIKDADEKSRKVAELNRYVETATSLDLPINIGTELNKPGQRFVDNFDAPALKPHLPVFLRGAQVMVGHTRLLRYAGVSYVSENARNEFPSRRKRNDFFAAVGALPFPDAETRTRLEDMPPAQAYAHIRDAVAAQRWL